MRESDIEEFPHRGGVVATKEIATCAAPFTIVNGAAHVLRVLSN
jgi:hypothetical protein